MVVIVAKVPSAGNTLADVKSLEARTFSSKLFYSRFQAEYDFDSRGDVDFTSDRVGYQMSYGLTERTTLGLSGGVVLNPEIENQSARWLGRSGYFWGVSADHLIFPATEFWPGVVLHLSGGSTVSYIDRLVTGGSQFSTTQKMSDLRYGGMLLGVWKLGPFSPYVGPQMYASDARWRNVNAGGQIKGEESDMLGVVVGSQYRFLDVLSLVVEGRLINETTVNAGLSLSFK